MSAELKNLIDELKTQIENSNESKELLRLIDRMDSEVSTQDKNHRLMIQDYQAQIDYLDGCIDEFRKELTDSINHTDNTYQSLFTLLSTIPNLVYFKDMELKYVMANHAFESWINRNSTEIFEKSDEDVYPHCLKRNIREYEEEVLKTAQGIYNLEEKLLIEDAEIWLLTSITPYKNAEGELKGIITSSLDITLRKKHELALTEANRKAQIALNIKNEFLSNISHELRTPLHGIAGSVEMLSNQPINNEAKQLIHIINQSNQSLLKQLDDLLLYTQAESQQLEKQIVAFNIKESVDALFDKVRLDVESKGVEFRYFIAHKIPEELRGDKYKLILLLETFLSNSIKFTEKGFIHLIVKESIREFDKLRLHFDIIDTGIGIATANQRDIFELFSAGDSSSVKKYSGTGLGLSLAKKMLDILNARYGFESKEHVGSHFWFELDLQLLKFEKQNFQILPRELPVLLVEDSIINQKIAYFTLKKMGFPVDIAENGQEAVDRFKQKKYRLVLMDIQMPVMDGFDATKQIRLLEKNNSDNSQSVIIALSANVLSRDVQHCFEVGMDEFISKPFSSDKLMEKINIYFNLK